MAELEIAPLSDRFEDDELADLAKRLEQVGAPRVPTEDASRATPIGELDDDALHEFYDRLEMHDLAAEVYLPVEFESAVEVGDLRVASAAALIDVLEEIKDEFEEEDEDDFEDDEDDDDDDEYQAGSLEHVWKLFYEGAKAAVERQLALHIRS